MSAMPPPPPPPDGRECAKRKLYDGTADGIFCYTKQTLLTYEVCFSYADSMVEHNLPFAAHWSMLRQAYKRVGATMLGRATHRFGVGPRTFCCCLNVVGMLTRRILVQQHMHALCMHRLF
jgi:hypothetical protein